ncbi:hypothetical protein GUJ93_ZPchr0012g19534 [Zizania palustris]|uniref:DUF295 domain-containing protein n=1 Tax=Zizania palustris TaxID=103762 RepID=A0A8J6BZG2_ZIZPA|nr:hypothetical protein GUJ93_ZPchr0012g19534 [Zizania palustris]
MRGTTGSPGWSASSTRPSRPSSSSGRPSLPPLPHPPWAPVASGRGWITRAALASSPDERCSLGRVGRCVSQRTAAPSPEVKGNCVYFTDDGPWSHDRCHEVVPDVGVLDLADRSFKVPRGAVRDLLWKWPPPVRLGLPLLHQQKAGARFGP